MVEADRNVPVTPNPAVIEKPSDAVLAEANRGRERTSRPLTLDGAWVEGEGDTQRIVRAMLRREDGMFLRLRKVALGLISAPDSFDEGRIRWEGSGGKGDWVVKGSYTHDGATFTAQQNTPHNDPRSAVTRELRRMVAEAGAQRAPETGERAGLDGHTADCTIAGGHRGPCRDAMAAIAEPSAPLAGKPYALRYESWLERFSASVTADYKFSRCRGCQRGFPFKRGVHYGTQALGMIPDTPCQAWAEYVEEMSKLPDSEAEQLREQLTAALAQASSTAQLLEQERSHSAALRVRVEWLRKALQPVCPCKLIGACDGGNCTCANPVMSGGCRRCATYGSPDQQLAMAQEIAELLDLGHATKYGFSRAVTELAPVAGQQADARDESAPPTLDENIALLLRWVMPFDPIRPAIEHVTRAARDRDVLIAACAEASDRFARSGFFRPGAIVAGSKWKHVNRNSGVTHEDVVVLVSAGTVILRCSESESLFALSGETSRGHRAASPRKDEPKTPRVPPCPVGDESGLPACGFSPCLGGTDHMGGR